MNKFKIAVYCRVSANHEEQESSIETQISCYAKLISSHTHQTQLRRKKLLICLLCYGIIQWAVRYKTEMLQKMAGNSNLHSLVQTKQMGFTHIFI